MNADGTLPDITIAVPGDWVIFDVDELAAGTDVAGLIDARIAEDVLRPDARDDAIALVERIGTYAVESGVRFAAALIAEDEAGPIVLCVTAAMIRLPVPDLAQLDPDRPADEIDVTLGSREHRDTDERPPGATFHDSVTTQVVIKAGPAVRLERVASFPLDEGVSQEIYSIQYIIPLDENGLTVTVTGVSPAIRRKSDIDLLLDEIADTVTVARPARADGRSDPSPN